MAAPSRTTAAFEPVPCAAGCAEDELWEPVANGRAASTGSARASAAIPARARPPPQLVLDEPPQLVLDEPPQLVLDEPPQLVLRETSSFSLLPASDIRPTPLVWARPGWTRRSQRSSGVGSLLRSSRDLATD